jgi:RNA polymerase-binding transcription factor DksA
MITEIHRAALRARRDTVKNEVVAILGRIDDDRYEALADQVHDTKDHATAQLLVESGNAELQRGAAELQDIDAALQRIAAGTYGRCMDCGTVIPDSRLSAYPTAKRCTSCQMEHEKKR